MANDAPQFKVTDRVVDRDGHEGVITLVTRFDGSHWYDVRFDLGEAVRYDADLTPHHQEVTTMADHPLITAALAMPNTHVVVSTYVDGTERRFETRSAASAETHADHVERPKIGRDLIDRGTGQTVRVVRVRVLPIGAARVEAVALRFCRNLLDRIGRHDLTEVVRLNATAEYGAGACASHDFCDANVYMGRAIEHVLGMRQDSLDLDAETTELWNQAWDLAIKQGFYVGQLTTFRVGVTYTDRAAGDHDLIYRWKVVARTAKTVTIQNMNRSINETVRRGIRVYNTGIESCSPDGRYSMAPVISADRWED